MGKRIKRQALRSSTLSFVRPLPSGALSVEISEAALMKGYRYLLEATEGNVFLEDYIQSVRLCVQATDGLGVIVVFPDDI